MMRKIIVLSIVGLCVCPYVFAQQGRNEIRPQPAKTNFSNVGVIGIDGTGVPGYIEMVSPDDANNAQVYYLYVDSNGKLRLASYSDISSFTSFPTGSWNRQNFNPGTVVGAQAAP